MESLLRDITTLYCVIIALAVFFFGFLVGYLAQQKGD